MKNRNRSGATLSFVVALFVVLVLVGVCFFYLSLQMGGSRELLHATDGGSLNVAKQALNKPDVTLSPSEEELNFSALIDQNGGISLSNYNRVVGQTLLVALNAEAEGSAEARQHADQLISVVQGATGIGARLRAALSKSSNMDGPFKAVAFMDNVRMLGPKAEMQCDDSNYGVAYMQAGQASNVDVDPQTLPYSVAKGMVQVSMPSGSTANQKSSRKFNYISGYTPIKIAGLTQTLSGVPVMPAQEPHLVSQHKFVEDLKAPAGCGDVPPNSFKSGSTVIAMKGVACSIVGALNTDFTAAIPHGYMVIQNGPTTSFSGTLGGADQIYAQELMTGIFVGPGQGNERAFTTNGALYSQWLNYNNAVSAGVSPIPPPPPSAGIFGNPKTITAPAELVTWTDYGDPPTPTAAAMLNSFMTAYPHQNTGTQFESNSLDAVELFKAEVEAGFHKVTRLHDPTDPEYKQWIPAPTIVTGMKAFNHNQTYSAPPGPVAFGQTGSLKQFLTQCNAVTVLDQIQQRMRQIKPNSTDAERDAVLNTQCIGMGQTLYIYKGLDGKLCISPSKPAWFTGVGADGQTQKLSDTYDLIHYTVDAIRDGGSPVFPFAHTPTSLGTDACKWTPSSGYRNLLGEMNFSNSTSGGGYFWEPN